MDLQTAQKKAAKLSSITDALTPICKAKKPDDIANFLAKLGITGEPGNTDSCPIANYVKKAAKVKSVSVGSDEIAVDGDECMIIDMTGVVNKFVTRFDKGKYPAITKGGQKRCDEIMADNGE